MKTTLTPIVGFSLFLSLLVPLGAQDAKTAPTPPNPNAFATTVYGFPAQDLAQGFVSKEKGQLRAPTMPEANADANQWRSFVTLSNEICSLYFKEISMDLPKGSLVAFDPATYTLVVRTTNSAHEGMGHQAQALTVHLAGNVQWQLHIVDAPTAEVNNALAGTMDADHGRLREAFLAQGGRHTVSMSGETKSGTRTTVKSGAQSEVATEYDVSANLAVIAAKEVMENGTTLELDPVVGADNRTIDLNVGLTHQRGPRTARWEVEPTGEKPMSFQWPSQPEAKVSTSISISSGGTALLGVWAGDAGRTEAAFITANVTHVKRRASQTLLPQFNQHAEAIRPTPKPSETQADSTLPPGMILRRFKVPEDFLAIGGDAAGAAPMAPADAFAAAAPASEPRFTRRVTVQSVLQDQGIIFPKGASANYLSDTSTLIVRNLPENVSKVEEFLGTLESRSPKELAIVMSIIQAPAATVRKWQADSQGQADNSDVWEAVNTAVTTGAAKSVDTAFVLTKPGTRATSSAGVTHWYATSVTYSKPDSKVPMPDKQRDSFGLSSEPKSTGFSLEVDPVVGADNESIDLTLHTRFDTAPPVRTAVANTPEQISTPSYTFYTQSINTSITQLSGSHRLLSVWKPKGSPELDTDVLHAVFLRAQVISVE